MVKRMALAGLAVMLAALVGAETLYIPAGAHAGGVGGTSWRTDLEVKARGTEGATFTLELLQADTNNSQPLAADLTVEAGHSLRLVDVIGEVFGFDGTAALRLTVDSGQILVTSRTYNDDPDGTFGQFIPAFAAETAAEHGFDHALIQLASSADYRSNLGLLNATGAMLNAEIDLHTAAGDRLGTRTVSLGPYELRQITDIFASVSDEAVEDGYALVRTTTADGRFFAYASVVDNRSGDAIFIPAQLEGPTAETAPRLVVFEAFMRYG